MHSGTVIHDAGLQPAAFRTVMTHHAASVAILTVADGPSVRGVTLSSLISLSLDPPLVLFALHRGSSMLPLLDRGPFGLTVLSDSQRHIAEALARPDRPAVPTCWLECPKRGSEAATIAAGAVQLTAALLGRWNAGDHVCISARVLSGTSNERSPLLHFRRNFAALQHLRDCVDKTPTTLASLSE
jgi:flavin reductase (DIM6/NTAB) family NADH-FMN oxidoreductase RutF